MSVWALKVPHANDKVINNDTILCILLLFSGYEIYFPYKSIVYIMKKRQLNSYLSISLKNFRVKIQKTYYSAKIIAIVHSPLIKNRLKLSHLFNLIFLWQRELTMPPQKFTFYTR